MPADEQDQAEALDDDKLGRAIEPPTADFPPDEALGVEDRRDASEAGHVPMDSVAERSWREEPEVEADRSEASESAGVSAEVAALHVEEP